jgi:aspartyl aminopeptidase
LYCDCSPTALCRSSDQPIKTHDQKMHKHTIESSLPLAQSFLNFVNSSRSPWHAVHTIRTQLLKNGYTYLDERQPWENTVKRNGKYFFTRNQSSIVVFCVGGKYDAGNGWKIIGAHTDSPDLRLKPNSKQEKVGYLQVGVQTYGGGLFHTWFDRDLTVAGRVLIANKDGKRSDTGRDYKFEHRLVEIKKPILRIPTLAIHLNREVKEAFKFNEESNMVPILATAVEEQLNGSAGEQKNQQSATATDMQQNHHSILLKLLAEELQVAVEDIKDLELCVVDTQPSIIGGAQDEFIYSARLDNLLSCFCSLQAMLNVEDSLKDETDIRVLALFDNEEVGSSSNQGAGSVLMTDLFRRLNGIFVMKEGKQESASLVDAYETSKAKSFLISTDMAHAVHPNYADKHHEGHRPMIHKGLVIKVNANQRYATTAHSSFLIRELAKSANVPLQQFVVKNDMLCGSTIGPILSANTGIRTVDVGIPQLSMHSIREMCGVVDVSYACSLLTEFLKPSFRELDNSVQLDY